MSAGTCTCMDSGPLGTAAEELSLHVIKYADAHYEYMVVSALDFQPRHWSPLGVTGA